MTPRVEHQRCRSYGDFVPLAEVPMLLANGWRVLDQLADDPLGRDYALLMPPKEREATA